MRRALLACLLAGLAVLPVSARRMTTALVQGRVGHMSNGTFAALAFSSTVTAGNLIVVHVGFSNGVTVVSVTDDKSSCTTYTQVPSVALTHADVWYCGTAVSGAQTVTVNFSGTATQINMGLMEISGAESSSIVDVSATATPASSNTPFGAAVTTLFNNTFVSTLSRLDNSVDNITGPHSGNAFTVSGCDSGCVDNVGAIGWATAYTILSSCTTATPQWDVDGGGDSSESITVAWKQSGATTCGGGSSAPAAIFNAPVRGGGRIHP